MDEPTTNQSLHYLASSADYIDEIDMDQVNTNQNLSIDSNQHKRIVSQNQFDHLDSPVAVVSAP